MHKLLYLLSFIVAIFSTNCLLIQHKYTYTNSPISTTSITKRYIPIYIDTTFSADDKLAIDNAIAQWNYVLNKQIVLHVATYNFDMEPLLIQKAQQEQGWLFLKVDNDNSTIPDDLPLQQCIHTRGCKPTLAWTNRVGGSVVKVIKDRMNTSDVESVMLHEIGHLLYLAHNETDKGSLMYPSYSKLGYLCVDRESAMKVAKTYALDVTSINYCISRY